MFRDPRPGRLRLPGLLLGAWLSAALAGTAHALPPPEEEFAALLVEAVTAAVELDLYHARCRRDLSGRRTDNLNKALASRFRLTVLQVQDELFPDGSYRQTQQRLQREFLARLKEAGGCRGAKDTGLPEQLRARYAETLEQVKQSP